MRVPVSRTGLHAARRLRRLAVGRGEAPRKASRASAFTADEAGDTAMMFGLMALSLFMFVGGAVDLTRWLNARSHTIDAIDTAVLAAGRALQSGSSEAAALQVAMQYYRNNTEGRPPVMKDTVFFEILNNGTVVAARGRADIRTPFMGLAYVPSLPLFVANEAPEANTAQNSAASYNREVALMLDVSGSMCSPCTKRDDMKAAAKDLVDIMMRNNGKSPYWSKIGLVPFSGDVRPPAAMLANVTDPAWPATREFTVTTGGKRPKPAS